MRKVKVWECKIIVPEDCDLPPGFDGPPRLAAIAAVESAGIEVLGCSSGWCGSLTKEEQTGFESRACEEYPDVYFAGTMDAPEDKAH